MPTTLTQLTWKYSPTDFFEAPFKAEVAEGTLSVEGGVATVTLTSPVGSVPDDLRGKLDAEVRAHFQLRQILTHRQFTLDGPNVLYQEDDGSQRVAVRGLIVNATVLTARADVFGFDEHGNVVRDTRVERVTSEEAFVRRLAVVCPKSPLLRSLVQSYADAVSHPESELVRLYEIRDALSTHYGDEGTTRNTLGVTKRKWSRLGQLANDAPLEQGRHRGWHVGELRPASREELEEARSIARELIEAFAATL